MSNRSALMLKIRPIIDYDKNMPSVELERFQNETLRPVVKFQNELLKSFFLHDLGIIELPKGSRDRAAFIEERLKKNLTLKNVMIGMITALFTEEEFVIYKTEVSNINKRIVSLLVQRLQDQL